MNITVNQYFILLEKDPSELKPDEKIKIKSFNTFIRLCKKYESLISDAALDILKEYNSRIVSLTKKENKTTHEEQVLKEFQSALENSNEEVLANNSPTRKLTKAGYIDATVILIILLNIGFIVAITIIGG